MKQLKSIETVLDKVSKGIAFVTAFALMFIMLLIVIDCILRFAMNKAIAGTYELVQVAMALVVFFGFAYAQRTRALVHVTFFMRMFPGKIPLALWALTSSCSAVISSLLTYASYQQIFIVQKINSSTTIMHIPLYPFYALMAIAFSAFSIVLIYDAIKSIAAIFSKEIAESVIAAWPS